MVGCGSASMTAPSKSAAPPPEAPGGAPASEAAFEGQPSPNTPAPGADAPKDSSSARSEAGPQPSARPGLGTEWGETRFSRITTVPFVRADASSPFATSSLFYNDEQGARAMANVAGFRRTSSGVSNIGGGAVQIGLRDESGRFLNGFVAGDKSYVVGESGQRYTIVVRNRTNNRFEVVLSVDGLDVLDGKAASFAKRGYLVDPRGELEVDGFRQSTEAVAAFRFGSVRNSYANQKHGETRNVGVIGVAVFHERGTNPGQWTEDEVNRRHDANPFPGQFATPPGR
jgi:hypothetical protein